MAIFKSFATADNAIVGLHTLLLSAFSWGDEGPCEEKSLPTRVEAIYTGWIIQPPWARRERSQ